jgi:hypothetical protein
MGMISELSGTILSMPPYGPSLACRSPRRASQINPVQKGQK